MRSGSIAMAVLMAVAMASPSFAFGGQKARGDAPTANEAQDRTAVARAVQQGKGGGLTRNDTLRGNAYRSQTGQEAAAVAPSASRPGPNWDDSAFRK